MHTSLMGRNGHFQKNVAYQIAVFNAAVPVTGAEV